MERGHLIGACGFATVGKDSVADVLCEQLGYVKVGFSDALCNMALDLNPIVMLYKIIPVKLRWLVQRVGWTAAKRHATVRYYLQWLGAEVCRKRLGQFVLINALKERVDKLRENHHVIVTNVRFPNEAEWVIEEDGFVVLVNRKGVGPVNDHPSDAGAAFPFAEVQIDNNGNLKDLVPYAHNLHEYANKRSLVMQASTISQLSVYTGPEELDTVSNEVTV